MSITIVTGYILAIAVLLMIYYIIVVVLQSIGANFDRFYDRYIRRLGAEQYFQLVALPLYGAIIGGLISTGIAILVSPPPGNYHKTLIIAYILFSSAILFTVLVPVLLGALSANPKKLIIVLRIDRLKNGDWELDTKEDILKTIEEDETAIIKKLNNKGIWFVTLLALIIVSDVAWLINHTRHLNLALGQAIVIAVVLGGLAARYWVRPKLWRRALNYLDLYRAEADRLSSPSSTPSSATAVQRHDNHHDLWIALGGLLVGAIITQSGVVRRRTERR